MKYTGSGNGVTHRGLKVAKWLWSPVHFFCVQEPVSGHWTHCFLQLKHWKLDCLQASHPAISDLGHIFPSMVVFIIKSVGSPTFWAAETSISRGSWPPALGALGPRRLSELVTTVWDKHGGGSLMVCECPLGVMAATPSPVETQLKTWSLVGLIRSSSRINQVSLISSNISYSKLWIVTSWPAEPQVAITAIASAPPGWTATGPVIFDAGDAPEREWPRVANAASMAKTYGLDEVRWPWTSETITAVNYPLVI